MPNLKPPALFARLWFPIALLCVLVLAVPGVILFGYHLCNREGALNAWLQERLRLSFHFPLPWPAGVVLLVIPPLLVLLYFLKLKRKALHVPSTFLWRKSIEDLHVNSFFQWLRDNLLLLLQLLIVVTLLYALLAPRLHGNRSRISRYILLIDNSASMAATDSGPSRLETAKAEAVKEIDARADTDSGMLIVFNSSAATWQPFTADKNLLKQRLAEVRQTVRPTRINEALRLAESLANPQRSTDDVAARPTDVEPGKERTYDQAEGFPTEVHLFSDGCFPDVPDFTLGNLDLRFHPAGNVRVDVAPDEQRKLVPSPESSDNVGIVSFNATRGDATPRGQATPVIRIADRSKLLVDVGVHNVRSDSAAVTVQLDARVDGMLAFTERKTVEIAGRSRTTQLEKAESLTPSFASGEALVRFSVPSGDVAKQMILHARLVDVKDRFPTDDDAWLAVGMVRKARVLLVGPGNRFLDAFFEDEAVAQVATLTKLAPTDVTTAAYRNPAREAAFDLVIFDRCAPATVEEMPRANTFFIGQPPPPWRFRPEDRVEFPHVRGWRREHPLLDELTALYEIGISEAYKLNDLPGRTPRLIETDRDMAVLVTLSRESFTDLVLTFSLVNEQNELLTNWPLQPSFPLFLRNLLHTLGNYSDSAGEDRIEPGEVKSLRPDTSADRVTVRAPDGVETKVERGRRADFPFGGTDQLGVYEVLWPDGAERSFTVNLLDADESDIQPRGQIRIGNQRIGVGTERGQPLDLWPWLAATALGLLVLEWLLYNRRITL